MTDKEYLEKYLEKDKLQEGLEKLKQNIPVQYIVGNVDFYGNKIKVNEDVLIPRFETELLVEKTINLIKKNFNKKIKILDLATGSGAIAITLKKKVLCDIDATDISEKALNIAKENALLNNVSINFFKSDMLDNINDKYDVIISNPPYISYDEKIEQIVYENEPHLALFAHNNGLEFYKKIFDKINNNLKDKYIVALEIGCNQANDIKNLAKNSLLNSKIVCEKDYNKRDRFIFITKV